jgi:hypothetical protein
MNITLQTAQALTELPQTYKCNICKKEFTNNSLDNIDEFIQTLSQHLGLNNKYKLLQKY